MIRSATYQAMTQLILVDEVGKLGGGNLILVDVALIN